MDNAKLKGRMSSKVQELQQSVERATAPDSSLALVDTGYLALGNNAIDIIRENLKNLDQKFWGIQQAALSGVLAEKERRI